MKILFEANDAVLQFDEENNTFLFGWKGTVCLESVGKVMQIAIKIAAGVEGKVHWLVDRRKLEGYSPESRIWIKNDFVNNFGKELISKTDKIAALESESAMAKLSAGVLTQVLKKANPNIESKEFDYLQTASNWLAGIKAPEVEKKKSKIRSLFGKKKGK